MSCDQQSRRIKNVLSIAGSDSSGGAGIQADLKVFSALGVYGMTAITAITAQNTLGITLVHVPNPEVLIAQLDAVFNDIVVDAVKIGALVNISNVQVVAEAIKKHRPPFVVLDPVLTATSNDQLYENDKMIEIMCRELLPCVSLITPNLYEAKSLLGESCSIAETEEAMIHQGRELVKLTGTRAVLVKGGHLVGEDSTDWLIEKNTLNAPSKFHGKRIYSQNTHGTGCSLSSAIAALIAQGKSLKEAISEAKIYVSKAIAASDKLNVGKTTDGHGPIHHFFDWWDK